MKEIVKLSELRKVQLASNWKSEKVNLLNQVSSLRDSLQKKKIISDDLVRDMSYMVFFIVYKCTPNISKSLIHPRFIMLIILYINVHLIYPNLLYIQDS
jgi:hypothetical protein